MFYCHFLLLIFEYSCFSCHPTYIGPWLDSTTLSQLEVVMQQVFVENIGTIFSGGSIFLLLFWSHNSIIASRGSIWHWNTMINQILIVFYVFLFQIFFTKICVWGLIGESFLLNGNHVFCCYDWGMKLVNCTSIVLL